MRAPAIRATPRSTGTTMPSRSGLLASHEKGQPTDCLKLKMQKRLEAKTPRAADAIPCDLERALENAFTVATM